MTREDFLEEYGSDWRKLVTTPMFKAALSVAEEEGPVRVIRAGSDVDRCNGAAVYYNEILGYDRYRKFMLGLGEMSKSIFEPKTKFSHPEV